MDKEEEYRDHAIESVALSQKLDSPADRTRLLLLAEAWMELSEKAAKLARNARERLRRQTGDQMEQTDGPEL